MTSESIKNILEALYEESPTIKSYVDAIAAGKPIPYTFIARSDEFDKYQQAYDRMVEILQEVQLDSHLACNNAIRELLHYIDIPDEFEEGATYEVIMFKGDAVVDGSRQEVSDLKRIKTLREYAEAKGYEFSARKL